MTVFRLGPLIALLAVLVAPAAAQEKKNELPPGVRAVLDKAEAVELLSLDPDGIGEGEKVAEKDRFHGYRVLGRTTLKDADTSKAVLAALDKGIKDSDGRKARCFNPRHGIRATADGKTADLVICFECLSVQTYLDGKRDGEVLTTGGPQTTFDKALRDAGVPRSPK